MDKQMSPFKFSARSAKNLAGVDERLAAIVRQAFKMSTVDFTVVEGLRTLERQKELVKQGASKTLKSKHLEGKAVDIYPFYYGQVQVNAPPEKFREIAKAMKRAAREAGCKLTWGGDWKTLVDMPHYQLDE